MIFIPILIVQVGVYIISPLPLWRVVKDFQISQTLFEKIIHENKNNITDLAWYDFQRKIYIKK